MMFALIDCNNFYASCERVFNPKLRNKPLVVLSNNDGCIIARSNEAKALQIKMGDPIYLYKKLIKEEKLEVLSSNFTLYGNMSNRVMQTIKEFGFAMEVYSIDEAFLEFNKKEDFFSIGKEIKERVYQWTGINVSVGFGPTKTLAKLSNKLAKKRNEVVCLDENSDELLEQISIDNVWGIGFSSEEKLKSLNIFNVRQLKYAPDELIKKILKTPGMRTVFELRGTPCFTLEEIAQTRKSIICSRSFGNPISSFDLLYKAIATFISMGAEKLRKENLVTGFVTVFIETSRFTQNYYANSFSISLPQASDYTPLLLSSAKNGLLQIFKEELLYKKAGILFSDLHSKNNLQLNLFSPKNQEKKEKIMKTVDLINKRFDKQALFFAAQGVEKNWISQQSKKSLNFTTSWDELLKIQIS
jgi:DNA polymerase V